MTRRAATLIETLVVLGVVAVLAAILVPVLQSVLRSRSATSDLSNMRQTMVDFTTFAASNRDIIVNPGLPTDQDSAWFYAPDTGTRRAWSWYYGLTSAWPRVLGRAMGGSRHWHAADEDWLWDDRGESRAPSGVTPEFLAGWPTRYLLGHTLYLDARGFKYPRADVDPATAIETLARVVRFADVRHPSRKGVLILLEWWGAARNEFPIAFADGSASFRNDADAQPTACHPTSLDPTWRCKHPVNCTIDGYEGRDF